MEMQPVDRLVAAVLEGDRSKVRELIGAAPALCVARNMFGAGAAHAARFTGRSDLLPLVLPDPVPFTLSVELGDVDAVAQALAIDAARARAYDGSGSTALHAACYWGQLGVAEKLLNAGADANARTREAFLQISPLGSAIATTPGVPQPSDDEDVVLALARLLLEHGAEPDAARLDGMTALHGAARRGLARVAQELIDAGADPGRTASSGPHQGETPADTAPTQGHIVLAARLDTGTELVSPYG